MISHAALFRLKHPAGSIAEADFLKALAALQAIPSVRQFEIRREVSPKNDFQFCVRMSFASQSDYDAYNNHPDHVAFVEQRWLIEVEAFMEHDSVPL